MMDMSEAQKKDIKSIQKKVWSYLEKAILEVDRTNKGKREG